MKFPLEQYFFAECWWESPLQIIESLVREALITYIFHYLGWWRRWTANPALDACRATPLVCFWPWPFSYHGIKQTLKKRKEKVGNGPTLQGASFFSFFSSFFQFICRLLLLFIKIYKECWKYWEILFMFTHVCAWQTTKSRFMYLE